MVDIGIRMLTLTGDSIAAASRRRPKPDNWGVFEHWQALQSHTLQDRQSRISMTPSTCCPHPLVLVWTIHDLSVFVLIWSIDGGGENFLPNVKWA